MLLVGMGEITSLRFFLIILDKVSFLCIESLYVIDIHKKLIQFFPFSSQNFLYGVKTNAKNNQAQIDQNKGMESKR